MTSHTPTFELTWIPGAVANLMRNNGIEGRDELAKATGLGRTTVYRAFADDWSGKATTTVLAAVASRFSVPLALLVHEPAVRRR